VCTYNGLSNAEHVLGDRILQREFRVEARTFPLLYGRKFKGEIILCRGFQLKLSRCAWSLKL